MSIPLSEAAGGEFFSAPFTCNVCSYKNQSYQRLQVHMDLHRQFGPNLYKCSTCKESFNDIVDLNKHRNIHSRANRRKAEQGVNCKVCCLPVNKNEMMDHKEKYHKSDGSIKTKSTFFKCKPCSKTFMLSTLYERHIESFHTNNKCTECGILFRNKRELGDHKIKYHLRNRNKYIKKKRHSDSNCTKCDHTFINKDELEAHMTSHNCSLCNEINCSCLGSALETLENTMDQESSSSFLEPPGGFLLVTCLVCDQEVFDNCLDDHYTQEHKKGVDRITGTHNTNVLVNEIRSNPEKYESTTPVIPNVYQVKPIIKLQNKVQSHLEVTKPLVETEKIEDSLVSYSPQFEELSSPAGQVTEGSILDEDQPSSPGPGQVSVHLVTGATTSEGDQKVVGHGDQVLQMTFRDPVDGSLVRYPLLKVTSQDEVDWVVALARERASEYRWAFV